jgi:hypothetical protein
LKYQGSDYEEYYLQGRDAMQFDSSSPTFSGNAVSIFMVEELSQAFRKPQATNTAQS